MSRNLVLAAALALIGLLTFLTLRVIVSEGFDVLVLASLLVLALVAVAIAGAMGAPPDD